MSQQLAGARFSLAAMLLVQLVAAPSGAIAAGNNTLGRAGTVIVETLPVAAHYRAYGRIGPMVVLPVRTATQGIVSMLQVLPGSQVRAGERLASLAGPQIESLLVTRRGALRSARAQLAAAKRALAIGRRQLAAQLSTVQTVAAARSSVAAATAAFDNARAQLLVARRMSTLRAPCAARVIALDVADGEQVMAGETVLTLQPSGDLWLQAQYYGADARAIRVGMTGRFRSAADNVVVPVRVAAVSATLSADGGKWVGLLEAKPRESAAVTHWMNGERGSVTLDGATRPMIAVPSRALILDRARWWVLVRGSSGDHPQAVVPGPTRGWNTFIESGLRPGQQVVVDNAFLEFHRGIAGRYQPPD